MNFSGSKDKSNGPFKNIICKYKINTTALNKNETNEIYQIEDILNKFNNNNNYKFLECMISLLNKLSVNNFSQSSITNNNINSNNFLSSNLFNKNNPNIYSSYKILEYSNHIVKGMNSINYIKTTSIGLLICGCSDKICLLNKSADKIEIEIKIDHYNIFEINQDQKKEIELLVCSNGNEDMKRLIIQNDNHQYKFLNIKDKHYQACFQFYKDYIIFK